MLTTVLSSLMIETPKVFADMLGSDLTSCNQWLVDNKLSLHVDKTESILFGTRAKFKKVFDFCVAYEDYVIKSKDSVSLDSTISGENMVNSS